MIALRHMRFGWWSLGVFTLLGLGLDAAHALKMPFYLDAGHETTRLLLRLAHSHGTGLALLNIVYSLSAKAYPSIAKPVLSACLIAATILMPTGFLLGGIWARQDPGIGVFLVPIGVVALVAAIFGAARSLRADYPLSELKKSHTMRS